MSKNSRRFEFDETFEGQNVDENRQISRPGFLKILGSGLTGAIGSYLITLLPL